MDTMRRENEGLGEVIRSLRSLLEEIGEPPSRERFEARRPELARGLDSLAEVERHYLRKEYQVFPVLERHGVEAPPKVMWAIHDDIRAALKEVRGALDKGDAGGVASAAPALLRQVEDMVYKEEKILFPMCLDVFSEEDWSKVREGEGEFGYALIDPPSAGAGAAVAGGDRTEVQPAAERAEVRPAGDPAEVRPAGDSEVRSAGIHLDTGLLTEDQLRLVLAHLPFDVTFVDENDEVRFYSEGDRIFPRSPGVIGRKVQNCHPPKSVHVVERILQAFRRGTKDVAEFWIEFGARFVHISYFAVRGKERTYRGVLEVVQDVTQIRKLEGQRRLLDW
ncbi:MAG: DUF438 domain-containing protein [Bacillota bacterium]